MCFLDDLLKKKRIDIKMTEKGISVIGILIIALITFKIAYKQCLMPSDYFAHTEWAKTLTLTYSEQPYFIWHGFTKLLYVILCGNVSIEIAASVATSFLNVFCYIIVDNYLKKSFEFWHGLVSLVLMIVEPCYFPEYTQEIYVGYGVSPNPWHSPTFIATRPFSVIAFVLAIDLINNLKNCKKIEVRDVFKFSIFLFISVLAKPSFFQGFFPALCFYLVIVFFTNHFKCFSSYCIIAVLSIPSVIMVMYQFIYSFFGVGAIGESGLGFEWGHVAHFYTKNMSMALILVLFFPLLFLCFNLKEMVKVTDVQLGCVFVCMSYLEYGLLYEKGDRMFDGNFSWAVDLSYFIIWMICLKYFNKDFLKQKKGSFLVIALLCSLLLIHLYAGLAYVNQLLFIPERIY